jgi:hypothetical protein
MINRFLFLFFLICSGFATIHAYEVEQFTQYDSTITVLDENKIEIKKQIAIRNVHDSGIIPGQVEFKIFNADSEHPLHISEYSAVNRYGDDIRSRVVTTNEYSSIVLDIFQPILPGFEYEITLTYVIEYDPSGIFFKRVEIPLKESTRVPILSGEVFIEVPEGKYFTYLSYENENSTVEGNMASFSLSEDTPDILIFEYSFIPLKFGPLAGSLVFWALVNVILLIILGMEVKREVRKLRSRRK